MNCEICDLIEGKTKAKKIYEDEDVIAFLNPKPATFGHSIVLPKKHLTIILQIPDEIIKKMFFVSQQIASIIFEAVGAEGTNIMISEGVAAGQKHAHSIIHIIPRKKNDGLSLEWAQKHIPEDSMAKIHELLKVPQETEVESAPEKPKEKESLKKADIKEGVKDYLLKHLRRIP